MRRAATMAALVAVLAVAAVPACAAAQFTAALVPPPPVPKVDTVAQADSTKEAARELEERMTSIKEWVDSAAAALAAQPAKVPPVEADSARMPEMPKFPSDTTRTPTVLPDTGATRHPPGRPRK